jgi:hypothetical protein
MEQRRAVRILLVHWPGEQSDAAGAKGFTLDLRRILHRGIGLLHRPDLSVNVVKAANPTGRAWPGKKQQIARGCKQDGARVSGTCGRYIHNLDDKP